MMDPYQVLGINRDSSDEEIKKAYRNLSRKYHPDANVNNPNKDQAEERFKQVQQAYDQIMKERQQGMGSGYTGGFYSGNAYSGNANNNQGQSPRMQAAMNYLRNHRFEEARNVLNSIPFSERQGRWYYYSAVANEALGNTATALEHINNAVMLEPSNMEYRQFQQHLEFGGTWYSNMGSTYEKPYSGYGNICLSFLCMQMVCGMCCRPF